jgi:hypothetical protein
MINKIVEKEDTKDMEALSDILEDLLCELKENDHDKYKYYKMKLYEMAYGKVLNEEMAVKIVHNMKPYGCKWDLETTNEVKANYGLSNIRDIDFFVVMNSAYNDYKDIFDEDLDMYVKYSKDFILDEDANDYKVFIYMTKVAKSIWGD